MFVHPSYCVPSFFASFLHRPVWLLLHMQLGWLVATDIDNGTGDTQLVLLIKLGWAVTFLGAWCFGLSQIPCLCCPPGSRSLTSFTLCPLMSAPGLATAAPRTQPWMTETLITQEARVFLGGEGRGWCLWCRRIVCVLILHQLKLVSLIRLHIWA